MINTLLGILFMAITGLVMMLVFQFFKWYDKFHGDVNDRLVDFVERRTGWMDKYMRGDGFFVRVRLILLTGLVLLSIAAYVVFYLVVYAIVGTITAWLTFSWLSFIFDWLKSFS